MTRAMVKNGMIVPIDPLPEEWADGRELWVEEAEHAANAKKSNQPLDQWIQEVEESAAQVDEGEWQKMQAVLDAMHKEAKEQVRREMGLS
jgi:hypothetical protein